MNLTSHLVQRLLKLPPRVTRNVLVQRDLRVPMPDGVELLADRWAPRVGGDRMPTALYRSPYGRRAMFGLTVGRVMAERGFQVLIVSTRGTFGSGGHVRSDATGARRRPDNARVGPWTHTSVDPLITRESLEFGLAHARSEEPPPRAPVRLYVMGEEVWRDFDSWPPKGYVPQHFYLQPDGSLSTGLPGES